MLTLPQTIGIIIFIIIALIIAFMLGELKGQSDSMKAYMKLKKNSRKCEKTIKQERIDDIDGWYE